jgi:hypothetical protein
MEFSRFLSAYRLTKALAGHTPVLNDPDAARGVLCLRLGVYNDGTYTLLPRAEAASLTRLAASVFPVAAGKIAVFAADWMGRLFATNTSELDGGGCATIVCLDLAEPSSFTTEANFTKFHDVVAVEQMDALLNLNQYREWVASGPSPGDGVRCVGYKVPLFLGGEDSAANMELSDRSVYLSTLAELWLALGS